MAKAEIPKIANDVGVDQIRIGVHEFECIGAQAPYDHPHVYLDMGDENEIICPYCSTRYLFDAKLDAHSSDPHGAVTSTPKS